MKKYEFLLLLLFSIFLSSKSQCLKDTSAGVCYYCKYNYYDNFYFTDKPSNFLDTDCILKDITPKSAEVYVSPKKYNSLTIRDGSFGAPFANLFEAFLSIHQNYKKFLYPVVNLYLLYNEHHFLNEKNDSVIYTFFKRIFLNITIQPLFCSIRNVAGCITEKGKVEIFLKTSQVNFFVAGNFTIRNIIINGIDLNLEKILKVSNENYLKYSLQKICNETSILSAKNTECFVDNSTQTWSEDVSNNMGLFNIEGLRDNIIVTTNPEKLYPVLLNISNCEFINLFYYKKIANLDYYILSFININPHFDTNITIEGSKFENFYFHMGMLSTYPTKDYKNLLSTCIQYVCASNWRFNISRNIISKFNPLGSNQKRDRPLLNFTLAYNPSNSLIYLNLMMESNIIRNFKMISAASDSTHLFFFQKLGLLGDTIILRNNYFVNNELSAFFYFQDCASFTFILTKLFFETTTNPKLTTNSGKTNFILNETIYSNILLTSSCTYLVSLFDTIFSSNKNFFINVKSIDSILRNIFYIDFDNRYSNFAQIFTGTTSLLSITDFTLSESIFYSIYNLRIFNSQTVFNKCKFIKNSIFHLNISLNSIILGYPENTFLAANNFFFNVTSSFIFDFPYSRNITMYESIVQNSSTLFVIRKFSCLFENYNNFTLVGAYFKNINAVFSTLDSFISSAGIYLNDLQVIIIKKFYFSNLTYLTDGAMNLIWISALTRVNIQTVITYEAHHCQTIKISALEDFDQWANISDVKSFNYYTMPSAYITAANINFAYLSNLVFLANANSTSGNYIKFSGKADCFLIILNSHFLQMKGPKSGVIDLDFESAQSVYMNNVNFYNNEAGPLGTDLFIRFLQKIDLTKDVLYGKMNIGHKFMFCYDNLSTNMSKVLNRACYNSVRDYGKIIYLQNIYDFSLKGWNNDFNNIGIYHSTFIGTKGKAVFMSEGCDIILYNCTFANLSSPDKSTILYLPNSNDAFMTFIKASNCSSVEAGGLFYVAIKSNIFLKNLTANDISSGDLGALFALIDSSAYIVNLKSKNTNANVAGLFHLFQGSLEIYNLDSENASSINHGNIYTFRSDIIMENITLKNIDARNSSVLNLKYVINCIIKNLNIDNSSAIFKGVLSISGSQKSILSLDNFIIKNSVCFEENLIEFKVGNIYITNTIFRSNRAPVGVILSIYTFADDIILIMNRTDFIRNEGSSAILNLEKTDWTGLNVTLANNTVSSSIFTFLSCILRVNNTKFINNTVFEMFYSYQYNYIISGSNSDIMFFGLYLYSFFNLGGMQISTTYFTLANSIIDSTRAVQGAGLNIESSIAHLSENKYINNSAENGGAVFIYNTESYSLLEYFIGNSAVEEGSDLLLDNQNTMFNLTNATLIDFSRISFKIKSTKILYIDSCIFINTNGSFESQAIYSDNFNNITIWNCTFKNLKILSAIKFQSADTIDNQVIVNQSLFDSCTAVLNENGYGGQGGAINVYGRFTIKLINSTFLYNEAMEGGSIYFDYSTSLYALAYIFEIVNCSFIHGIASQSGGAIKSRDLSLQLNNTFQNNSATIGNDLCGPPTKVLLFDPDNFGILPEAQYLRNPMALIEASSGEHVKILALVYDRYDNFLKFESEGRAIISVSKNNSEISIYNNIKSVDFGVVNITEFFIISKTLDNYTIQISYETNDYFINQTIPWRTLNCSYGEIFINSKCEACSEGFYFLGKEANIFAKNECTLCPPNANCPGKNIIIPNEDYWRFDNMTKKLVKCKNAKSCQQIYYSSSSFINNQTNNCSYSYEGNLCYNCIYGYSKDDRGDCIKCSDNTYAYFKFVFLNIFSLLFLSYQTMFALKFAIYDSYQRSLIKVFINHNYYLTFLSAIDSNMPSHFLDFLSISENLMTAVPKEIMNFDCLFTYDYIGEDLTKVRFVFYTLYPLFVFLILSVFNVLIHYIRFRKNREYDFKGVIYSSFIIIINNYYYRILNYIFSLFKCSPLNDSDDSFLSMDPNLKCWTYGEMHLYIVLFGVLPNFLLWGLSWPAFLVFSLRKNRKEKIRDILRTRVKHFSTGDIFTEKEGKKRSIMSSKNTNAATIVPTKTGGKKNGRKQTILEEFEKQDVKFFITEEQEDKLYDNLKLFKYLTVDYKNQFFFWEGFFYISNIAIILINIVSDQFDEIVRSVFNIIVYFIMFCLTKILQPFRYEFVNNLFSLSYIVLVWNVSATSMVLEKTLDQHQKDVIYTFIILGNVFFYSRCGFIFIRMLIQKNKVPLEKIINFLKSAIGKMTKKKN